MTALGICAAALFYSGTLAAQRVAPALKAALAVPVAGVHPTYYARVLASLLVGAIAAAVGRNRTAAPRRLAWGTSLALAVSVVLACAFP